MLDEAGRGVCEEENEDFSHVAMEPTPREGGGYGVSARWLYNCRHKKERHAQAEALMKHAVPTGGGATLNEAGAA